MLYHTLLKTIMVNFVLCFRPGREGLEVQSVRFERRSVVCSWVRSKQFQDEIMWLLKRQSDINKSAKLQGA